MIMSLFNIKAMVGETGRIILAGGKPMSWETLSENISLQLPKRTDIIISVSINCDDLIKGKNGIVWATTQLMQAEIIQNALMAQQIGSSLLKLVLEDCKLHLIQISNTSELDEVMNFIWKSESGLRLKPDWTYPAGEPNKSFNQWLDGR
jgi:hypothetical protein